ncbi:hypothetical protein MFLAVUS_008678 [Mucor flavus]|uniref:Uncharacterized protein n=1 Tax=Mucor flavus TaxID=439312 RepID=A0ABP9Z7Y5_9FUNG
MKKICKTLLKTGKTLETVNTTKPKKIAKYSTNFKESDQSRLDSYPKNQHPLSKQRRSEEDIFILKVPNTFCCRYHSRSFYNVFSIGDCYAKRAYFKMVCPQHFQTN